MTIQVHGAGVAGLLTAVLLQRAGHAVVVHSDGAGCSPHGGGMLAPDSELDAAEAHIVAQGHDSRARWIELVGEAHVLARGTLHVAHRPEWPLLEQLTQRIERQGHPVQRLDARGIAELEPLLGGRFHRGILLPDEAAVDPAVVLPLLRARVRVEPAIPVRAGIDARGLHAPLPDLRGVRGEYVVVHSPVQLSRPVRLAHPRYPLYVVPRANGDVYVGATQLERTDTAAPEVRSLLELLSALYSLHPDFGDARLVTAGTGLRPAFPDNAPRVFRDGAVVHLNGLFRHGYLLGPALAAQAVDLYLEHCHGRLDQR